VLWSIASVQRDRSRPRDRVRCTLGRPRKLRPEPTTERLPIADQLVLGNRSLDSLTAMYLRSRTSWRTLAAVTAAALALAACGTAASSSTVAGSGSQATPAKTRLLRWNGLKHVLRVVDVAGPRSDGAILVATAGHLALLRSGGQLVPFARGAGGYSGPVGLEPYIAVSPGRRVVGATCSFPRDVVYALRLGTSRGVTAVSADGHAHRFVTLGGKGLLNGITFDTTGRFGHRLLVTSGASGITTVFAIDCRGHVQAITRNAPKVEGGIAVAPASFGRFAGDLIAPNEVIGKLYAIAPDGTSTLIANSGIAHGQDVGIESGGFVPPGFGAGWTALVSDRLTPGNRHPGDDLILSLTGSALIHAGVHPGDLLLAGEGGAATIDVACAQTCQVREIALGPSIAHLEGHIAFRHVG
jgi:hypothetical protein